MIKVERFVNELMTSNCFVVYDEHTKKCVVIDPGSEKSEREINFIKKNHLLLEYIFVTHEHTDHNWGVNALKDAFDVSKVVCSEECSIRVKIINKIYFLLYYDDPDYVYQMTTPDIIIRNDDDLVVWNGITISFFYTPGHSFGSMCIKIGDLFFTGDTIMPYKPYFNGRDSNEDDWYISIEKVIGSIQSDTIIYPGHGDPLSLGAWINDGYAKSFEKTVKVKDMQY